MRFQGQQSHGRDRARRASKPGRSRLRIPRYWGRAVSVFSLVVVLLPRLGSAQAAARAVFEMGSGALWVDTKGSVGVPGPGTTPVEITGPGARFRTELDVGGKIGTAPVRMGYSFCRGDAAALVVESNGDVEVLALSRAEMESPDQASARADPAGLWRVALARGAAKTRALSKGQTLRIPVKLDDLSQDEQRLKILLIVAGTEVDLTSHVVPEDLEKSDLGTPRASSRQLSELDTKLQLWRRNVIRGEAKSRDRHNYAFAVDPDTPALIEATFESSACERRFSLESLDAQP